MMCSRRLSVWLAVRADLEVRCSAQRSVSTWRGTRRMRSRIRSTRSAIGFKSRATASCVLPLVASWRTRSGDLAGRGVVGGSRHAHRISARIPSTCCSCAGDAINRSRIATVVCVPLTSNLAWADAAGNVLLSAQATGLPKDSVANVSQVLTLDKAMLTDRVGKIARAKVELLLSGIDVVLGR